MKKEITNEKNNKILNGQFYYNSPFNHDLFF